jgi:hypothetical protein
VENDSRSNALFSDACTYKYRGLSVGFLALSSKVIYLPLVETAAPEDLNVYIVNVNIATK